MGRMKLALAATLLVFGSGFAAACGQASVPVAASAVPASGPVAPDAGYLLGAGDMVRMIVYNQTSLSADYTVSDGGTLAIPLIGTISAAGRTVSDVQAEITLKLADGYLRNPSVSLEVAAYRPFYILGEVQKPGQYPYSSKLTVMGAIAIASGLTYSANRGSVFIKRAMESGEKKYKLTADLTVNPGDTIRIGQRHF